MELNSCLYEVSLHHKRFSPKPHQFGYKLFLFYLDIDEIDSITRLGLIGTGNKKQLYTISADDFLPEQSVTTEGGKEQSDETTGQRLRQKLQHFLCGVGIEQPPHRIALLTCLRTAGYIFNPVAFYFCFDESDQPLYVVAEVCNTFREKKLFFIPYYEATKLFQSRQPKQFYVSPFFDLDIDFEFSIAPPGTELKISIDDYSGAQQIFTSSMRGKRIDLTRKNLITSTLKFPLVTIGTITRIHWQALRLWLKRIPHHAKEHHTDKQVNVLNPYRKMTITDKLCRKILIDALARLPIGNLIMTLEDGTQIRFGGTEVPADGQQDLGNPVPNKIRDGLPKESGNKASRPAQSDATPVVADLHVLDSAFYKRCVMFGHIGFAEAYMDGLFETSDVKALISWFIANIDESTLLEGSPRKKLAINMLGKLNRIAHLLRSNNERNSAKNISAHYDLSNELFKLFLDSSMTYSSAKFSHPAMTLEEAQLEKIDSICRKLRLKSSDTVLEVGSGWGAFAIHAATKYGCSIKTITISKQQFEYTKQLVSSHGLSHLIDVELVDYRNVTGLYDKIVSIEMIEAVGDEYMDGFFQKLNSLLRRDGLLALQMITCPDSRYDILKDNVDFIQKHIFPGSLLPSVFRVMSALRNCSDLSLFEMEDMGLSYARTLDEWYQRFNNRLPEVRNLGFDARFIRMWNYYLKYCSAAFSTRNVSVVQAVFSRPNNKVLMEAEHLWADRVDENARSVLKSLHAGQAGKSDSSPSGQTEPEDRTAHV
jgi:cyclopropane-fatty-acyl-phospholipid synthase